MPQFCLTMKISPQIPRSKSTWINPDTATEALFFTKKISTPTRKLLMRARHRVIEMPTTAAKPEEQRYKEKLDKCSLKQLGRRRSKADRLFRAHKNPDGLIGKRADQAALRWLKRIGWCDAAIAMRGQKM